MSFTFIINRLIIFLCLFIFSCKSGLLSKNDQNILINQNENYKFEKLEKIDYVSVNKYKSGVLDYYSNILVDKNFLNKDLKKIKINSYENNFKNNLPINSFYIESFIYSINHKGQILKFDSVNGKLVERISIDLPIKVKNPVSLSLIQDDLIIGFKSGEIVRINKKGKVIWKYINNNVLNTPIKFHDNNLIILYSDTLVILSPINGQVIFEKSYPSSKIIQSSGGKISNYFNLLFFILPNSEFQIIDTFLNDTYFSDLDDIEIKTSLNNLDDKIHIYKNLLVYLDNNTTIHTYDLIENKYLISNYFINKTTSSFLYNNTLVIKNQNNIEFYNIKNGKIFFQLNIDKILKKETDIINVMYINNKLHIFSNDGILLILNEEFEIENKINLKIKKIKKIFNYQKKIFIITEKGITYIF